MKNRLRTIALASLLLMLASSLFAIKPPAPVAAAADTNFLDPKIVDDNSQIQQLTEAMKKQGVNTDSLMDENFLFASLLWGSVGAGYLIYARKQRMIVPLVGGVAMLGVSYFVNSWIWMSVVCIALIVAMYQLIKRGF